MGRDPQPQELTIAKGVRQGEDHHQDGARRAVAVNQQGALTMGLCRRIDLLGPQRSIRLRSMKPWRDRDSVQAWRKELAKSRNLSASQARSTPVGVVHALSSGAKRPPLILRVAIKVRTTGPDRSTVSETPWPGLRSSDLLRPPMALIAPAAYSPGTAREIGYTPRCIVPATQINRPADIGATVYISTTLT